MRDFCVDPVKRFQSSWSQSSPGAYKIRNSCFQSPPPQGVQNRFQSHPPPLLTVNWIAVLAMVTDCKSWKNLQVLLSILVCDETYMRCPVCTYVSFITNCKSDNSTCKFRQPLQSRLTTIQLTVTRVKKVCPFNCTVLEFVLSGLILLRLVFFLWNLHRVPLTTSPVRTSTAGYNEQFSLHHQTHWQQC